MFISITRWPNYLYSAFLCLLGFVHLPTKATTFVNFYYEEQELKPYYMGADNEPPKQNPGVFIEILQQLDQSLEEISIRYHRRPWKRCLHKLKENTADAIIASYQADRDEYGVYPQKNRQPDRSLALLTSKYCLFTRASSSLIWSGESFRIAGNKPVAVPQGYSILDMLNSHGVPIVTTNSTRSGFELLINQRAEGTVTFCETGERMLRQQFPTHYEIRAQSPELQNRNAYLIFSKAFFYENDALVRKIWQEMARIREQEYVSLLARYDAAL